CRNEKFRQPVRVVKGGATRQESVAAALEHVSDDTELVAVHDAVRPFVAREQVLRVIEEARKCGAAILGIPAMDTVKEVKRASLFGVRQPCCRFFADGTTWVKTFRWRVQR